MSAELLERARPYLRRPASCEAPLAVRDGVLDLLGSGPPRRGAQKSFDHAGIALLYDRLRAGPLRRLLGVPEFAAEFARVREGLALERGDVVLDLACGHGNFTVALAESVGPGGLVIGVDIARPMLRLARARVARAGLENVLLVHGDAHDLPIANHSLAKLNCSGGLHALPDPAKALAELARVSLPGTRLTASSFAEGPDDPRRRLKRWLERRFGVSFVPLDWLGRELERLGFEDYESCLVGGWLGCASARLPDAR